MEYTTYEAMKTNETYDEYITRMTKFYILNLPKVKDGHTMPIYDTSGDYDKNGNIKSDSSEFETGPTYIAYVPYDYYLLNNTDSTHKYNERCGRCEAMKQAVKHINQNTNDFKYMEYVNLGSSELRNTLIKTKTISCGVKLKDDLWSLTKLEFNKRIGKFKRFWNSR
jgi:hypothetical protein